MSDKFDYGTGRRKTATARTRIYAGSGNITVNGCAIKLMGTPPAVRTPAPALGQDNGEIYRDLLGLDEAQYDALKEKHVF